MKRLFKIICIALLGLVPVSCYDDTSLWDSIDGQADRIKALEDKLDAMNSDLKALQELASAISGSDYVKDVSPVVKDGVEVGYKITFAQYGEVVIYHGNDGADSENAPLIGIVADEDGIYYWAIGGEWLLDDNGNKIPASAEGVTPQLKIENDKWYVSYDEGDTWEEMGAAVLETLPCLFTSVTVVDNALVIELADGTVLSLPIGAPFRIVIDDVPSAPLAYDTPVEVRYALEGLTDGVMVFALSNHWMFDVDLVEDTPTSGKLIITQEDYMRKEVRGKIALFASDESGLTVSKVINVTSGVLTIVEDEGGYYYDLGSEAGQISVTVASNIDYEVNTSADWITLAQTKALEEKTFTFDIAENSSPVMRWAEIEFTSGGQGFCVYVQQAPCISTINIDLVADEYSSYSIAEIDLTSLKDQHGNSIKDALGYGSWEELRYAIGYYDQMLEMFSMPVSIFGYYPDTGEYIYDRYNTNGAGYWLDKDGCLSYWGEEQARVYWEIYSIEGQEDNPEYFIMNTGVMPGKISVGEVYTYGVAFVRNDVPAQVRIQVNITVVEYQDPETGKYPEEATPGTFDVDITGTLNIDELEPSYQGVYFTEPFEEVKNKFGMTTKQFYDALNSEEIISEYVLQDGTAARGSSVWLNAGGGATMWGNEDAAIVVEWYASVSELRAFTCPYPSSDDYGPYWGSGVLDAVGKTIYATYRLTYSPDGAEPTIVNMNYAISVESGKSPSDNVIWEGDFYVDWSGMGDLSWGAYDWSSVEAGTVLTAYFTLDSAFDYWMIRFANGSWMALPSCLELGENIQIPAGASSYSIKLTQADIDMLVNEGGLVITGCNYTLTRLTLSSQTSEEIMLYEGEMIVDDWSSQYALSDAGTELMEAGAQAGQVVNFYMEPLEDMWQLEIFEGHWGSEYLSVCSIGMGNPESTEYDLAANGGKIKLVLTQEILDAAFTQQWWGGTFVLNGDNVRVTKITLSAD